MTSYQNRLVEIKKLEEEIKKLKNEVNNIVNDENATLTYKVIYINKSNRIVNTKHFNSLKRAKSYIQYTNETDNLTRKIVID